MKSKFRYSTQERESIAQMTNWVNTDQNVCSSNPYTRFNCFVSQAIGSSLCNKAWAWTNQLIYTFIQLLSLNLFFWNLRHIVSLGIERVKMPYKATLVNRWHCLYNVSNWLRRHLVWHCLCWSANRRYLTNIKTQQTKRNLKNLNVSSTRKHLLGKGSHHNFQAGQSPE